MALTVDILCKFCGKTERISIPSGGLTPTVCCNCRKRFRDRKKREHFGGLDALTIEERLRKIEEWIYDYKPPVDLNDVKF